MKVGIIDILRILIKHSDESNPLTAAQINTYLSQTIGVTCSRQTIYKNIKCLNNNGIEILNENSTEGYYYHNRLLEKSEVEFLCHAIIANSTIPSEQSNQLMNKILSTQSIHFQSQFKSKLNLHNLDKKENKQLFYNIDVISATIDREYKLSFQYTKYNKEKEIVLRSDKIYEVIPYFMLFKNNRLYVVGFDEKYKSIVQYRVDRMINIKEINEPQSIKYLDPYEYARNRVYMHGGKLEKYKFNFDEIILDEVIDLFGKEVEIEEIDGEFYAEIEIPKQEMIYFSFQFINYVRVLEPQSMVEEIKQTLKSGMKKYDGGK